ncbi:MAG TPA: protein phosphatase 2C domain-containing protein [Gemmatimonadaceae bacterium]|nr:protein phosphatase 2C domain-containing protein [Gemmatimonadaceae bacterium]
MTTPPTPGGVAPGGDAAGDDGAPAMLTDAYGLSHTGLVPRENQDRFIVARMRKVVEVTSTNLDRDRLASRMHGGDAWLLAVADGVGGRVGGAEASSSAVETTLEYIGRATGCFHRFDVDEEARFIEKMEESVLAAHDALLAANGDSQWSPATTLTMVMLVAPRAYIIHVGDTRAYYLRGDRLLQLTRDQTFGQYLLDSGAVTDDAVADSPMGRTLASAVGSSEVHPTVGLIDLEAGDTLLLCSDGLTKHVPHDELQRLLRTAPGARAACEALVNAALAGGGTDNVSVVVARMS